jgi:hypothetical protein
VGSIACASLPIMMGDASGTLEMNVDMVVQPPDAAVVPAVPTLSPSVRHGAANSAAWRACRMGPCHLQAFHMNWEGPPGDLQLERKILTGYWADGQRALQQHDAAGAGPHNW